MRASRDPAAFVSQLWILPPYLRHSKSINALLAILDGIATDDLSERARGFAGQGRAGAIANSDDRKALGFHPKRRRALALL